MSYLKNNIAVDVGKTSDNHTYFIEPLGTYDPEILEASECDVLHYMAIYFICMKLHCFLIRHCQKNKIWQLQQLKSVYCVIYAFICQNNRKEFLFISSFSNNISELNQVCSLTSDILGHKIKFTNASRKFSEEMVLSLYHENFKYSLVPRAMFTRDGRLLLA